MACGAARRRFSKLLKWPRRVAVGISSSFATITDGDEMDRVPVGAATAREPVAAAIQVGPPIWPRNLRVQNEAKATPLTEVRAMSKAGGALGGSAMSRGSDMVSHCCTLYGTPSARCDR